jgi:hypothetical protein
MALLESPLATAIACTVADEANWNAAAYGVELVVGVVRFVV